MWRINRLASEILLHIDGAAKGNPGPAAIGVVAFTPDGTELFHHSQYIGETTNNVAEYTALIEGLKLSLQHKINTIRIASDSELIVRQIHGLYQVKTPHLKKLYNHVLQLMEKFEQVEIFHVPREKNTKADSLANQAIKKKQNLP
jgi:ribonuclease HI